MFFHSRGQGQQLHVQRSWILQRDWGSWKLNGREKPTFLERFGKKACPGGEPEVCQ